MPRLPSASAPRELGERLGDLRLAGLAGKRQFAGRHRLGGEEEQRLELSRQRAHPTPAFGSACLTLIAPKGLRWTQSASPFR